MKSIIVWLALLSTGVVEHDDRVGARDCLALVVFSEARGESWLGQAAVAQVVINRAKDAGEGVCDIAMAPRQFHGLDDWPYPRRPKEIDATAWAMARQVSDAVLEEDYSVQPPACADARYFYRSSAELPGWAVKLRKVCEIGNHTFLAEAE